MRSLSLQLLHMRLDLHIPSHLLSLMPVRPVPLDNCVDERLLWQKVSASFAEIAIP